MDANGTNPVIQHYVRDAQGNIMAIYKLDASTPPPVLSLSDRSRYCSSGIGVDGIAVELPNKPNAYLGYKTPEQFGKINYLKSA